MADANRDAVIRMLMAQRDNPSAFDEHWTPMPPERSAIASALMGVRDKIPENPDTQWSAANMARGALERSANLQDTVAGYRDPKTADPLDLVPMLAPGAIAGALRGPARSTLMSAGGVPPKDPPGFTAYHGSPHEFDRFSMDKIGTGEGAQAYGHGLYFADAEGTARSYRDQLGAAGWHASDDPARRAFSDIQYHNGNADAAVASWKDTIARASPESRGYKSAVERLAAYESGAVDKLKPGHMYEVRIKADPNDFFDFDKRLVDQPKVAERLGFTPEDIAAYKAAREQEAAGGTSEKLPPNARYLAMPGGVFYESSRLTPGDFRDPKAASAALRDAGIPGIRYDDAMSRPRRTLDDMQQSVKTWENAVRTRPDDPIALQRLDKVKADLAAFLADTSPRTRNTVVFDDKLIEIIRKYGLAAALMGGGAAAMGGPSSPAAASE